MHSLFTTYIEQKKINVSAKLMKQMKWTATQLPAIDQEGTLWSKKNYVGGYTSYGSISRIDLHFSVFESLKKKIDQEVKKYCKKIGLKFDTGSLELSAMWVNLMPKNVYHAFHIHPLSVISGTFYVSVGKGSRLSPLRIEDPRASLFMSSPPRPIQVDLKPKNGDLILFESWTKHEVPPHQGNEDRISISFNYDWLNR
jgi:uncharacterized protein (TIGR02466 family)